MLRKANDNQIIITQNQRLPKRLTKIYAQKYQEPAYTIYTSLPIIYKTNQFLHNGINKKKMVGRFIKLISNTHIIQAGII